MCEVLKLNNKKDAFAQEERYNRCVLIGNWNEEKYKVDTDIQQYLLKQARGQLVSQKLQRLYCNLLKEVQLTRPENYLSFGSVVQIISPDIRGLFFFSKLEYLNNYYNYFRRL